MLNETFLKSNHKFLIGGYKIYREDRPSNRGGVLIAIKKVIIHEIFT